MAGPRRKNKAPRISTTTGFQPWFARQAARSDRQKKAAKLARRNNRPVKSRLRQRKK